MPRFEKKERVMLVDSVWRALVEGKVAGVNTDLLVMEQAAKRADNIADPLSQSKSETLANNTRRGTVVSASSSAVMVNHDSGQTMTWQPSTLVNESEYTSSAVGSWMPAVVAEDITGTYDTNGGASIDAGKTRGRGVASYDRPDEDFATRRKRRRLANKAKDQHAGAISSGRTWVIVLSSIGRDRIKTIKGVRYARRAIHKIVEAEFPPEGRGEGGPKYTTAEFRERAKLVGVWERDGLKACKEWVSDLSRKTATAPGGSDDSLVPGNADSYIAENLTLREAIAGLGAYWSASGVVPDWGGHTTDAGLVCAYDRYRGCIVRLLPRKGYDFEYEIATVEECADRDGLVADELPTTRMLIEMVEKEGGEAGVPFKGTGQPRAALKR